MSAANLGGFYPTPHAPTNFGAIEDPELQVRLYHGSPPAIRAIGDCWGQLANAISERGLDIDTGFKGLRAGWTGRSAAEYEQQIRPIVRAAQALADLSSILHDLSMATADTLQRAQDALAPPPSWSGHKVGWNGPNA